MNFRKNTIMEIEFPYSVKATIKFNNTPFNATNALEEVMACPEKDWVSNILDEVGHTECKYDGGGAGAHGRDYFFFAKTLDDAHKIKELTEERGMIVDIHKISRDELGKMLFTKINF